MQAYKTCTEPWDTEPVWITFQGSIGKIGGTLAWWNERFYFFQGAFSSLRTLGAFAISNAGKKGTPETKFKAELIKEKGFSKGVCAERKTEEASLSKFAFQADPPHQLTLV